MEEVLGFGIIWALGMRFGARWGLPKIRGPFWRARNKNLGIRGVLFGDLCMLGPST